MANQFDDISKGMASNTSRRGMFKMLGVGVVGAVATALHIKSADAATPSGTCLQGCKGLSGTALVACMTACSCEAEGFQVCGRGLQRQCCSPNSARCLAINSTQLSINGRAGFCLPIPDYTRNR